MRPEPRVVVAWVVALVMLALLLGSLTGQGTGVFGSDLVRGLAWSYAVVGILMLVFVGFAKPRGGAT